MAKRNNVMRVVFLSPHSDPEARPGEVDSGGQCVYEYELAKSLSLIPSLDVTIYCRKKFRHPVLSIINERFRIKRISCGGGKFIPKEKLGPHMDEFARKVAQDQSGAPDIVHGHYWDGGKASLLLVKHLDKSFPIIWTPHSLGTVKRRNFIGIKNEMKYNFVSRIAWETFVMVQSDRVVVSTENEKQQTEFDYGIYENKIEIIPPGIQIDNFAPIGRKEAKRRLNLPDEPVFMSLGRLDKRKGYHNCIMAFAAFRRRYKTRAKFVIFAGNPAAYTTEEKSYMSTLKELVAQNGLAKEIVFRPALDRDEVKYAFAASEAYLCLSDYEPFGLTILESMAMGIPVVATSNGGPKDIITHGVNGYSLRSSESGTIANILQRFLKDPKHRQSIVAKARRTVEEQYSWERRAEEFADLYKRVCKSYYRTKKKDFLDHIKLI